MELVLKNKQVSKVYKEDGSVESEEVQSVAYDVKDGENIVGSANVYAGGFSLNVNNGKSIDELTDFIEGIL